MIPALLGIPGRIKVLIDLWTSTRAGYLDRLNTDFTSTVAGRIDVGIGTRAAGSTALNNATWTDARAAKLDKIGIKSIQNGSVTVTLIGGTDYEALNTGTLSTSIVVANSIILLRGIWRDNTATVANLQAVVAITATNQVTCGLSRSDTSGGVTQDVHYTVLEFY